MAIVNPFLNPVAPSPTAPSPEADPAASSQQSRFVNPFIAQPSSTTAKPLGLLDTGLMIGGQIVDAAAYELPAAIAGAIEGDQPYAEDDWKDALIRRAEENRKPPGPIQETAIPGIDTGAISNLGPSLGFSVVGMGAGLGAGIAAAPLAPATLGAAPVVAGGAASFAAAQRMAENNFVRELYKAANEQSMEDTGKPIAPEAFAAKQAELADEIRAYGLWEAVPEAAGNVIGFGILKAPIAGAVGRLFGKNVLTRFASKTAAVMGSELATETPTQMGQQRAESRAGLTDEAPREFTKPEDWKTSFKEVAPSTILQTALLAGGAKGVMALRRTTPEAQGETPPAQPSAGPVAQAPVTLAEIEQMRVQRLAQLDQEERGHEGGVVTNPEGGIDVIAPRIGRELSPQEKGERLFLTTRPPEAIARRYGLEITKPADAEIAAPIIAAQDEDQAIAEFEKAATANVPAIESQKVDILGDAGRDAERALRVRPTASQIDARIGQEADARTIAALESDLGLDEGSIQADAARQSAFDQAQGDPELQDFIKAEQQNIDIARRDARDALRKRREQDAIFQESLSQQSDQQIALSSINDVPQKTAMQIAFERAQQRSQPLPDQAQAARPTASVDVAAPQATTTPQALPEATRAPVEQRNPTRQERIAQMTPADIEQELYVSRATGIKNRRALDEDMQEGKKAVTFIDLDGLKYINDTLGHEKGNELLKKFADAMKAAGIDGYHVSGDEFAILSDNMVKAKQAIKALEAEAKKARIDSDTDSLQGITFSYGMSKDLATADANMQKMKASREQAGLRVRGGRPPNLVARLAPPSQPAPQQAPTTPAPRGRRLQPFTDNRLSDPEARLTLQAMADAAGWAEVGGRLTRDSEGNVGRTKWIPRADWFGDIQADKGSKLTGNLKGLATRVAVQKALSGEPMTEAQKRHVIAMLEWKSQEQLDYEAQNTGSIDPFTLLMAAEDVGIDHGESLSDEALAARALEIDEEAVMRAMAASEYESEFLDEMRRIVDGEAQRQGEDQAVGGSGAQVQGAEAGQASQEGFSLAGQTEAERAAEDARLASANKAERDRQTTAEQKARADRDVGGFRLSGSDLPADQAAAAGQGNLLEGATKPETRKVEPKAKAEEAAAESGAEQKPVTEIGGYPISGLGEKALKVAAENSTSPAERKAAKDELARREEAKAKAEEAAEKPTEEDADDGRYGMVSSGEVLRSESGRVMSPVPRIDTSTNGKLTMTLKRHREWLLSEARQEATGNRYLTTMLSGLKINNLSQSDMDSLNAILFGDELGPKPRHRVTAPNESTGQSREPQQEYSNERDVAPLQNGKYPTVREADEADSGQLSLFAAPTADKRQAYADLYGTVIKARTIAYLKASSNSVKAPEDVAHLLASIRKNAQEALYAVVTDKRGKVLRVILHTRGLKTESSVSPLTLIAEVASIPEAARVHLGHNHPSGDPTPSRADIAITEKIRALMDGTGISMGHHVVVAGKSWGNVDATGHTTLIEPLARTTSVPVTERVITKRGTVGDRITTPDAAARVTAGHKDAVFLLNAQHDPVGIVPLTAEEMKTLRSGGGVNRLLSAINTTNASAAIIKTDNRSAAVNVIKFLRRFDSLDIRVLDWIGPDGVSAANSNNSALGATGPFFSRGRGTKTLGGESAEKAPPLRELIIQHNLTAQNLLHADRMGGIPVPSLAVTRASQPMSNFGEITLIGNRDLADPKRGTKVFGADIYSPRYPDIHYKIDANGQKTLSAKLAPFSDMTGQQYFDLDELQRNGARYLADDARVMAAFLDSKGIKAETVRKTPKDLPAALKPFANDTRLPHELAADPAFIDAAYKVFEDALIEANGNGYRDAAKQEIASLKANAEERGVNYLARQHANDVSRYQREVRESGQVDRPATKNALRNAIEKNDLDRELEGYAADLFESLRPSEHIFKGFTYSGKRSYTPHTLDNVIKILKKEMVGGEDFNYGVGSIRAKFTPQFRTIEQIRAAKGRLKSASEFESIKDDIDREFFDVAEKLAEHHPVGGELRFTDSMTSMMSDAAKMGIPRALKENGFDEVPVEKQRLVAEFLTKLRNLPAEYFEAKIPRAVRLSEFSAAVVPTGTNKRVLDILKKEGIPVIEYTKGDEFARAKAIESAAQENDLRFSRGQEASPETINIDGVDRQTTNSEGRQGEHTVASVASAIEAKLGKGILSKIADNFKIVKDMAALKADMKARGSKFVELVASKDGFLTKGLYDPSTDTSYIVAGNLSAEDSPYGIFLHEVGEHYGLEKMLGPEAYNGVLNQAQMILRAGGKAMREAAVRVNASENVGLDPDTKNFHRLFADKMAGNKRLSREVIAYLADNPNNHELPFMRRIMVAVREFMRKLGFTKPLTTDDIVSLITTAARRSGEFATRGGEASTETIKFGGAARPTTNSDGQPIHPTEEGLRNFWRWFGDSKVVDDQGRPLVVYHGTRQNVSEFDPLRTGTASDAGWYGSGFYFTPDPDTASSYAANRDADSIGFGRMRDGSQDVGANVIPVYLRLRNPYDWHSEHSRGLLQNNAEASVRKRAELEALGHDGVVVFRDFIQIPEGGSLSDEQWGALTAASPMVGQLGRDTVTRLFQDREWTYRELEAAYGVDVAQAMLSSRSRRVLMEAVVFRPEQIKSALGNQGSYDPSDPSILRSAGQRTAAQAIAQQPLFSRKNIDEAGSLVGSKFTLPAETFAQKAQRYAQDEANRFQVVQDAVIKQGGTVDESSNIADAIKRYPGRLAAAMKDTTETLVEPFAKRIHDAGTTTDEVSLLAYAEHAPERNAEIAKINPRFPNDGTPGKSGSGMTDQEAADIIKQVKAMPNAAEMFRLSQELRDITDQNLDNLVAGGEMEQSQADEYRKRYKFYVPLKGFELVDESGMTQPTGKGLSTGSKLGFRAMGRESRAGQIFEHVIQDYENGLMLSEKAVVAKTLRNFIKANPDDALWTIDNAPKKPRLEKGGSLYQIIAGGNLIAETASKDYADRQVQALLPTDPTAYVAEVKPSPKGLVKWRDSPFDPEEEIRFIENGKPVRIQLADAGMVRSYNRLWHAGVSDGLTLLNSYNGWLRQMYTQKNPAWFFMNAQKDVLSVMPYVTGEAGIKTALKIPGNIPGAFKAARAFHHGKTAGAKWNALIDQFKATGGYTGFAFVGDIEAQTTRLNGAIARHTGWDEALGKFRTKGAKAGISAIGAKVMNTAFFSWVEAMNSTFENMTRLAVFKSALDSGMTPNEAGKLAKNASTNFNTRGEWGPNINAVWLFANAGIQGTRNVGHALMFSPHKEQVWALMGGLVALGVMTGLMSDDDDDLLDDQIRSKSLVFKVGDAQLSLPMPYGFGFFSGFGQLAAQAMKHPEKRDNIALKMATLAFDHFSPVGDPLSGEADLKNAVNVAPTSIRPVLNVAANVSPFGGGPLFPESPYDETKPDSTKMWTSTRGTGYDNTAKWLNALTGGDQYKAGAISVSPETLKLSVSTLFGGAGKLASDVLSLPFDVYNETLAPSKVPLLKNYIREVDQKAYLGRFYEHAQEAQDAYTIWRRYLKAGMVDEATSYKQGEAAMISMGGMVSSYRKQIKTLRDLESMTVNSGLSPTEKNLRLAKTNAAIVKITSAFNDRLKSFR